MSTPVNHWKLGLFVVFGVVLGIGSALVLGARSLNKQTVGYESYFDESVQGLEIGSPVKFRGVTIGTVSQIGVAPDRRHVQVTSALGVDEINVMGLGTGKGKHLQIRVPPELRVQLASAGITGVKFLQLDFFDIKNNPPPSLPFPVPENYIPVEVSTMKNLEDSVVRAVDRFPELADAALKITGKVDALLDDVDKKQLPERASKALARVDSSFTTLGETLGQLDARKLSGEAQVTLGNLNGAVGRMNKILERVDGDRGVLANLERASDSVGDAVSSAPGLENDFSSTLQVVQQAADSIQRLTNALERDSDMLIKGRAKASR